MDHAEKSRSRRRYEGRDVKEPRRRHLFGPRRRTRQVGDAEKPLDRLGRMDVEDPLGVTRHPSRRHHPCRRRLEVARQRLGSLTWRHQEGDVKKGPET